MIETIAIDFLEKRLSVPVYAEFPSNPPERFVVIHKTGSGRENMVDSAMLVADSYGTTRLDAAMLNEQVKAAMDSLIELNEINSSLLSTDYPFPDTKNKRYRYQAVQNITHY